MLLTVYAGATSQTVSGGDSGRSPAELVCDIANDELSCLAGRQNVMDETRRLNMVDVIESVGASFDYQNAESGIRSSQSASHHATSCSTCGLPISDRSKKDISPKILASSNDDIEFLRIHDCGRDVLVEAQASGSVAHEMIYSRGPEVVEAYIIPTLPQRVSDDFRESAKVYFSAFYLEWKPRSVRKVEE